MDDLLTCEVCMEKFSTGNREPLVLECGHTFCRNCLINVSKEPDFLCPSCRRPQNEVDVSKLTVNYKLLSAATEAIALKYGTCNTHSDELTYWCQTCLIPLCVLCIFNNHPQTHKVVQGKAFFMEKKRLLELQFQKWQTDSKVTSDEELHVVLQELKSWCIKESNISKTRKSIADSLSEITGECGFKDLLDLESKISNLMLETEASVYERDSKISSCSASEETPQVSSPQSLGGSHGEKSYYIQTNNGQEAELQWQDGKLLMFSFSKTSLDCDLLLKIPGDVFLELSIKDKLLGQVIIQPWYNLLRAQYFATLCLGIFGVSYVGSSFKCVLKKNEARECLMGGWYQSRHNGGFVCTDLMTGLEWGGKACGKVREGIVMATYEASNDSSSKSGFGICTRGQKNGIFQCPFGKVLSGLDVVKKAVQHDPVSEVTISRCGAIAFDPSTCA